MLIAAILFVFLFQLLSDFVETIYAFGLLGTSIPPEIVAVALFFTPALLLLARNGLPGWLAALLAVLVLVAAPVEVLLDTRGRMLVAGLGVGAFLVLLPALLQGYARRANTAAASELGAGLTLALVWTVAWRTWTSGVDPSNEWLYRALLWVLALAGAVLLWRGSAQAVPAPAPAEPAGERASFSRAAGLSVGLVAAPALLYFGFISANVIARWGGADYPAIVAVLMLALAVFAVALALLRERTPADLLVVARRGSIGFVVALALTLLAHSVSFPAHPGGYPFPEPPAASWHWVSLLLAVALLPFVLLDFILYARELIRLQPRLRALGGGFLIAAALLLVLIFAHVFTTVYDYIPVVGPLFRDRFWLVYLAAGLALILPLALLRPGGTLGRLALPRAFAAGVVLLAAAAVVGARATAASPAAPPANATGLRVLTYNIQQGYSADGLRNHAGQLALLRRVDAGIIGLQESDTNRIAGGNADVVRYFADELDLYSYYGPKVTAGTFGIALLSKYPIENPRTFYLYSTGEQTAGISAQIAAGGKVFNVFVTHLGNGGPIEQQRGFLREVEGRANVIAMGDFNFEPDGEQYRLTTDVLADAWLLRWPAGVDDRGLNPADRIDHIFVSPGMTVRDARFLTGPESDHPAVVVDIGW